MQKALLQQSRFLLDLQRCPEPHEQPLRCHTWAFRSSTEMQRESMCTRHNEMLKLFCKDELKPLCLVCNMSREHQSHVVCPIEESMQEYKDDLEKLSDEVKNGCKILRKKLNSEETAMLKRIEEMNKKCCNLQKEDIEKMPEKVLPFIKLIKDIEDGCKQSAGDFLKDVENMAEKCRSLKRKSQSSTVKTPKGGKTKNNDFPLTERTTPSHPLPFKLGSPHSSSPSSVAGGKTKTKFFPLTETTTPSHPLPFQAVSLYRPPSLSVAGVASPSPAAKLQEVCSTMIKSPQIKKNITSLYELNAKRAKIEDGASSSLHGNICEEPSLKLEPWMKNFRVYVKLDEETAHSSLILSESNTNVQNNGKDQPRPKNVKRFTIHKCVLGIEGFTSGHHYWEVDVMKTGGGWCVGIAGEFVKRTKRIKQSPEEAVWVVGHSDGDFAYTSPPTPIPLLGRCRTLAMYLDYDKGLLAIFDANTSQLLHSFQNAFKERIFPYLNVKYRAELNLRHL